MNDRPKPEYRQNPQPAQPYRVAMRIENAPGDFGDVRGFAQYDVTNVECLPPPKENPGGYTSPVPTRSLPLTLTRGADGGYVATVFADGMLDEDYFGRGTCHWQLKNVQAQLKATGAKAESLFMADLYGEEVVGGDAKTLHYSKNSYPRHPESKVEDAPVSGQPDRARMASWLKDDDVFTITLSAERAR